MVYILENPPLGQARNNPTKMPSEAEAFSLFQGLVKELKLLKEA